MNVSRAYQILVLRVDPMVVGSTAVHRLSEFGRRLLHDRPDVLGRAHYGRGVSNCIEYDCIVAPIDGSLGELHSIPVAF